MLSQALVFLITTVFGFFSLAFLLRFVLQVVRAPARNPLSQFLAAVTDFAVRPARRFVPGLWGMDLSTLLLAWLTESVEIFIVLQVRGMEFASAPLVAIGALALLAAIRILRTSIYIVMAAVVAQAVISWINPYSPVAPLMNSVARPFLRPFQKLVPPVGNVDLSPVFVLVAGQLLLMVPVAWLEVAVTRLF